MVASLIFGAVLFHFIAAVKMFAEIEWESKKNKLKTESRNIFLYSI